MMGNFEFLIFSFFACFVYFAVKKISDD